MARRLISEWGMPFRQLLSHNAFLLRRVMGETMGFFAVRAGSLPFFPPFLRRSLLHTGVQLLPRYSQSHIAMGEWVLSRGKPEAAMIALERAIETATRVEEQPVLPLLAPRFLRLLGFSLDKKEQLQTATTLCIEATRSMTSPGQDTAYLRLQEGFCGDEKEDVDEKTHSEIPASAADPLALFQIHPEHPDNLIAAGEALLKIDDIRGAYNLVKESRHRYPADAGVWRLAHRIAVAAGETNDANTCLDRRLIIDPNRASLAPLLLGDTVTHEEDTREDASNPPEVIAVGSSSLKLGETVDLRVRVLPEKYHHVVVLAPYGFGVAPVERIVSLDANGEATITVHALRPDRVNLNRPWEVTIVVTDGTRYASATAQISVTDPEPGRIMSIITNDHELHDFRAWTHPRDADVLLIAKAQLCEKIAESQGAAWGHMIEASAIRLLEWLGEIHDDPSWQQTADSYREHLIDAIARGHDFGLHIHAFFDPDGERFTHHYDEDSGALQASPKYLFTPSKKRPFWHRAYPLVGEWNDGATKRGSLLRTLARLEGLGRLGNPGFRVALFRAGGYDIGKEKHEKRASLFAIRDAGILADSDVVKARIYNQFSRTTGYLCTADDPAQPCKRLEEAWLPELVPEYNVEGDFLANAEVLNRYVDERVRHFTSHGKIKSGVHVITSMSHTKFINFRRGLDSENLDTNYGDWKTIDQHLAHLREHNIPVVRIREAVDAVVDDMTPEPILVRGEEEIFAAAPGEDRCEIRYPLQALGRGIPLDQGFPFLGVVHPPAWAADILHTVEIRSQNTVVARREKPGFESLVFSLNSPGPWEMRLTVPAEYGVFAEKDEAGGYRLRSERPFRRANVVVAGQLFKNLPFESSNQGAQSRVETP